mmetsp:Transcript_25744/g.38529  ORF Transcript_25744/g.38529 Transcript_25744/m.38529 type:complete len:1046 (+) Transcript_25744:820-3957(+)
MSLYDTGKILQKEGRRLQGKDNNEKEIEDVVAEFGRNIRLICQNCTVFSTVGAAIISTAEEMIRIFERLFFDWVLSPENIAPPLEMLDDERCVVFHPSDEDSMVLLCDGCEGKFNMTRLDPPLSSVPKGDWYCPRCRSGYCWTSVDCRIGRKVLRNAEPIHQDSTSESNGHKHGIISACVIKVPEGCSSKATLVYDVCYNDGTKETLSLEEVDEKLRIMGDPPPRIRCVEAVAESPGYGCGIKNGLILETVPIPLNPLISDAAAQLAVTSTVFQDMVTSSAVLSINDIDVISASEWLKILILLMMKCAATDKIQELANKIENEAHTQSMKTISNEVKAKSINDIIPKVTDDEDEGDDKDNDSDVDNEDKVGGNDDDKAGDNEDDKVDSNGNDGKGAQNDQQNENEDGKQDPLTSTTVKNDESNPLQPEKSIPNEQEILQKQKRIEVVNAMKDRQKARENSFLANCIKTQIKPAVASFEDDNVSRVINTYLSSSSCTEGVDFSSSRCVSMKCDLCGLSDIALATPLVRAPNHSEWLERMPFTCGGHKSFLVASFNEDSENAAVDTVSSIGSKKKKNVEYAAVTVRLDGEIVSTKERDPTLSEKEMGIVSFLPKNERGFQYELKARARDGLPFMTGSLVAHECCALAAHKSRMERVVREEKEKAASTIERNFGNTCGRTLSLGSDDTGRCYWRFDSEPNSLFVSTENQEQHSAFLRFSSPESIASVIKSLGRNPLAFEMQKTFPQAANVLNDGTWSNLLQKRRFKHLFAESDDVPNENDKLESKDVEDSTSDSEVADPFDVGEEVLVESASGKLLWDGEILAVAKSTDEKVTGYRVRYTEWSSRFDEWVEPKRVVEPNDNNILVQEELLNSMAKQKTSVPSALLIYQAVAFLDSPNRAKMFSPVLNYSKLLATSPSTTTEKRTLALLRCATLIIEAALPAGSVDSSANGPWNAQNSAYWRSMVVEAETPGCLMGCIILLENTLSSDWLRPNAEHLLSCLPRPWKAINDASVSSIALRLLVLDRGIKYGLSHDEDGEWRTWEDGDDSD